jgi:hypothetical protein
MDEQSIRNGALPKSGTPSPNPWDSARSGQNGWLYNTETRTEDKAPQACDLSAASSAGMARAADAATAQNRQIPTRPRLTYCGLNLVLTKGSTLGIGFIGLMGRLNFASSQKDQSKPPRNE